MANKTPVNILKPLSRLIYCQISNCLLISWTTFIIRIARTHLNRIKRKSAFKHAQNAKIQINLRIRKVSPGTLLSYTLWYAMILLADSGGHD